MPSLEILEMQQSYENEEEYDEDQFLMFLENIRFLKRASLLARIIVLDINSHPIHVLGSIPTPSLSQ